jgi:hypothetical protein
MENNEEFFKPHPDCPILDIDGFMSNGKQFDVDITLPQDNRNVIYGTVKNFYKEPVKDAVVKLIEIVVKDGYKKRVPVTHTFTDEYGEFVFGPLCPDKEYAIDIWVDDVRHYKFTAVGHREGECLKGKPAQVCECKKPEHRPPCDKK